MTPERMARVVARWARLYTRGLPGPIAQRRVDEIAADVHDHVEHARARGVADGRIARSIASRMVRGLPADAMWRGRQADVIVGTPAELRRQSRRSYRRAALVAVGGAFVLFWLIGAVGIIGDSGDAADRLYLGVFGVGALGAVVARFRAAGLAWVLLAMAVVQSAIAAIALLGGMVPSYNSPFEILGLNGFFVALFVASAWLFRRSGRQRRRAREGPSETS
jgi:hypothetical protein